MCPMYVITTLRLKYTYLAIISLWMLIIALVI